MTLDIETTAEQGFPDVQSCGRTAYHHSSGLHYKRIKTWGVKPYQVKQKNHTYIECKSELDLLTRFIDWWMENTPEVITGWNVQLFDIPYIAVTFVGCLVRS